MVKLFPYELPEPKQVKRLSKIRWHFIAALLIEISALLFLVTCLFLGGWLAAVMFYNVFLLK